jgi:hypothetical protein
MFWIGVLAEAASAEWDCVQFVAGKYGKGRLGQKKYEEEKSWENW